MPKTIKTLAVNTATPLEVQATGPCRYLVMAGKIGQHKIEISISEGRFAELIELFNTAGARGIAVHGTSEAEIWITKES